MIHFFSLCWDIGDLDAGNCSLDGDDRTFFYCIYITQDYPVFRLLIYFLTTTKKKTPGLGNSWIP